MAVVGSAEIIVRAITDKVKSDIEKAFKDARPAIQAEGREAGKAYASAFSQSMKQKLRPALANATKTLGSELESGLVSETEKAASEAGKVLDDTLTPAAGGAGGRAGRAAGQSFGAVFGDELKSAFKDFAELDSILDLLGPALAGIVQALSSVVSGLFAMGAAAVQAAGSIAALPGLFAAAAQGFGAVMLAFRGTGVLAAIKAGTKLQAATGGIGSAATKAASAAKTNQAAQVAYAKAVQKATDNVTQAQKEATAAQRELSAAQKGAAQDAKAQEQAQNLLNKAVQVRNQTLADPNATATAGAGAQKMVDDAKNGYNQIVAAKTAADKRLQAAENANSNAQQKLAAAQAAKAALKAPKANATTGVGTTPAVKAANAYNDALAKLTPQARAFVEELLLMKSRLNDVGKAIGNQLFPPLTEAMKILGRSDLFKILNKQLSSTGGIVGQFGKQMAQAFVAPKNLGLFNTILHNNNVILGEFTKKNKDGQSAASAFVSILLKFLHAIQPITDEFARFIVDGLEKFDKKVSDSRLTKFFNDSGKAAKPFGDILRNLGTALINVGKAMLPIGTNLTGSFDQATKHLVTMTENLQKWMKTDAGKKWSADLEKNFKSVGRFIDALGLGFLKLGGKGQGTADFFDTLTNKGLPAFFKLIDKLNSSGLGKQMGELFSGIISDLEKFSQPAVHKVFIGTLEALIKGIGKILDGFHALTKIPGIGGFIGDVGKLALVMLALNRAISFAAKLTGFTKSFELLRKTLIFNPGKNLLSFIKSGFKDLDKIKPGNLFKDPKKKDKDSTDAGDKGQTVGESLAKGIADGIKGHELVVIAAIDDLMGELIGHAQVSAKDGFKDVGKYIVQGVAKGITKNIKTAVTAVDELGTAVIEALKDKLGIHSPSVVMDKLGVNTGQGYVDGVRSEIAKAFKAGEDLADAAASGAKSGKIETKVSSGISPAAKKVGGGINLSGGVGKINETEKATGKLSGTLGKLGSGISSLAGGPIGILLALLPALIAGFTELYKKSPQFKKFIDTMVGAVKPFVEMIGKTVLKVLNGFFGWVNAHMPQIKKVFGDVFKGISFVWDNILKPVFKAILDVLKFEVDWITKHWGSISNVFKTVFNFIRGLWENVLKPVFSAIATIIGWLWNNVISPDLTLIKNIFNTVFTGIKLVWDNVLHPVFNGIQIVVRTVFGVVTSIIDGFKNGFKAAGDVIATVGNAIGAVFNGIKNAALAPIRFVVNTIYNNGIRPFIDAIPGIPDIPEIKGFSSGGWTGPGGKHKPAGIVHADEYVVNKEARKRFENLYPGLLDHINKSGSLPGMKGYATGGKVTPWNPAQHHGVSFDTPADKASRARDPRRVAAYLDLIARAESLDLGKIGLTSLSDSVIESLSVNSLNDYLQNAYQAIGSHVSPGDLINGAWNGLKDGFTGKINIFDAAKTTLRATYDGAPGWIRAIIDGIKFIATLPSQVAHSMSSDWGKTILGFPEAAVNGLVGFANQMLPSEIPGLPIPAPFGNVNFKARGGRVRAGSPYVVGEFRPELFIPDSNGSIIPDLARLGASPDTIQKMIVAFNKAKDSGELGTASSVHHEDNRTINVNVHNPVPERASQSVSRTIRQKAVDQGWNI